MLHGLSFATLNRPRQQPDKIKDVINNVTHILDAHIPSGTWPALYVCGVNV